jgi:hypothetical protein
MAKSVVPAPVPVPRLIPSVVNADPAVLARESTAHADAILRQSNQTAAAASTVTALAVGASQTGLSNVLAFGAKGDGVTDDTAAIQAAIDQANGGVVWLPTPAVTYRFSNLTLPSGCRLMGAHMRMTTLRRLEGATGPAIREKTPAEGNPSGATGIRIEQLCVDGAGGSGDGIDLGSQTPGLQLASQATISNVYVSKFPTGVGFKLQANAISFYYLWVDRCSIGIQTLGAGANIFHSIWSELCTQYHLLVQDIGNQFFGIQIEDAVSGTSPTVRVESFDNTLSGIFIALGTNKLTVIQNVAGANRNVYRDILLVPHGNTWTDLVRHDGTGAGTGATDFHIGEFVIGESTGAAEWYVNGSTGVSCRRGANLTQVGDLSATGSSTLGSSAGDVLDVNGSLSKFGSVIDGGVYVFEDELGFAFGTNATASGFINFHGFSHGSTQFRDLSIRDGKTAEVCLFTGSTKQVDFRGRAQFDTVCRGVGTRAAAPSTGTAVVGDIVFNGDPVAAGFIGWVCVTAGSPGTWKSWGAISP